MAIKIIGSYAKKLGLPGYSSHSFSVSAEVEITDLEDVRGEATLLYQTLQEAVDAEIVHIGYIPGGKGDKTPQNGNGSHPVRNTQPITDNNWSCSEKQKELLLKLVSRSRLSKDEIENLAVQRFGVGVKNLNRLQASGLISELIEQNSNGREVRG